MDELQKKVNELETKIKNMEMREEKRRKREKTPIWILIPSCLLIIMAMGVLLYSYSQIFIDILS